MLVTVKEDVRRYYVGFEIDHSVKFKKGPNKGRPQTVTACKIFLLTEASGQTLVASGVTVLGSKDKPDVMEGLKFALSRALTKAKLGRYVNALIWQEFQLTHRRIDTIKPSCAEAFSNVANFGGIPAGVNPDPGGYKPKAKPLTCWHKRAVDGRCLRFNATCNRDVLCDDVARYDTEHLPPTRIAFPAGPKPYPNSQEAKRYATGGMVHGYGGFHTFQKRAIKKMIAMSKPRFRLDAVKAFYGHSRHEYGDIPFPAFQSYTGRAARVYVGGKKTNVRKIAGLGWTITVNEATGEVIRPRTEAQKRQQLRDMYSYGIQGNLREIEERLMQHSQRYGRTITHPTKVDFAEAERRVLAGTRQQAEDRCHRIGKSKPITIVNHVDPGKFLEAVMGGAGAQRVRDILKEADAYKKRAVADDGLTAKMLEMHRTAVVEAIKLDAELLTRPGISRVHDEYCIDGDVFKSKFCVGDIVTSLKFGVGTVTKIEGVFLTVQPGMRVGRKLFGYGSTKLVPDWDCKKKVGRLKRFWTTVTKWWDGTTEVDKLIEYGAEEMPDCVWPGYTRTAKPSEDEDGTAKIPGRGLWNMIKDGHCDACHGRTTFRVLPGMYTLVKCRACGQTYRLNADTRTAKTA